MECPCCWNKRLFAWLLANFNDDYEKWISDRKQALFASLQGSVLEIGPGTGVNLAYYPPSIDWIGIEPNPYMHPYLQEKADALGINIVLRQGVAEKIEAADNSVDAVVSTLVLCSVPNLHQTLQEIVRVLKPGRRFYFIEHVAAPKNTSTRRVQEFVLPLWKVLADGCHPNRETGLALANAGFAELHLEEIKAPFPVVSPHIIGTATKKGQGG